MTYTEVSEYFTHLFNETHYIVETEEKILIYTRQSKWFINKKDKTKFGVYGLYHFNNLKNQGYHLQKKNISVEKLVFIALRHDLSLNTSLSWEEFQQKYDLYQYGQQLYQSTLQFDEECALSEFFSDKVPSNEALIGLRYLKKPSIL